MKIQIGEYTLDGSSDGYSNGDSCPEQHWVYLNGVEVGYLRLRHGNFTADCHGEEVYQAYTKGDGCFDDGERESELLQAIAAIDRKLKGVDQ